MKIINKKSTLTVWMGVVFAFLISVFSGCGAAGGESKADNAAEVSSGTAGGGADAAVLVSTQTMAYRPFEHFFQANGTVEAVRDAFISPEINGRIKKIHVREGDRVRQGRLLVSLDSEVTERGLAEVKTALELARTVYQKRKGLWEKKIGSEIQYLEARTNKESLENKLKTLEAQLNMSQIKAPISGIVDQIFKKEGELAVPGFQLIQLVNLENVLINADVSESYLPSVTAGASAQVIVPSYPGLEMEAVIHRTGQVIKARNRTFLVQLLLDNPGEKLKPNMVVMVKMRDYYADRALLVPSIIIKNDLKGPYLYVVETNEKGVKSANKVYVKPGRSQGGETMVLEGLNPGLDVVVEGYNIVKNGMPVKIGGSKQ